MGIMSAFDKWGSRGSTIAAFWPLLPAGLAGVITARMASGAAWLSQFGPLGWWSAGLAAFTLSSVGLFVCSLTWDKFNHARATKKWAIAVDTINPLDADFINRRIRFTDLVHPVHFSMREKSFRSCQLVGPAGMAFLDGCTITRNTFINCDFVLIKYGTYIYNATAMTNVTIIDSEIIKCIIYVQPSSLQAFKAMGVNFVNLTGDDDVDGRHPNAPETKRFKL